MNSNKETHPDDIAVDNFAEAMKAKLAKKREQGRGGWNDPIDCKTERLQEALVKGDPVDVGNYAMMLFNRGEKTQFPIEAQKDHIGDSNEMVEKFRDAITSCLTSVYVCTRVWSAWSYGTMSQDDFIEASETEFLDDLVGAVMGVIQSQPITKLWQGVRRDQKAK